MRWSYWASSWYCGGMLKAPGNALMMPAPTGIAHDFVLVFKLAVRICSSNYEHPEAWDRSEQLCVDDLC